MAYTAGELKAISNFGGNTVWFFKTNDTATVVDTTAGYFNADYQNLKQGDVILACCDLDGTATFDGFVVTSADGATTVTVNQ